MAKSLSLGLRTSVLLIACILLLPGCSVSVKAPDEINIGSRHPGRRHIDARRVPPTRSHEEARQRLIEAYARIEYLDAEIEELRDDCEEKIEDLREDINELEDDLKEMEDERDAIEEKYDALEDRLDD